MTLYDIPKSFFWQKLFVWGSFPVSVKIFTRNRMLWSSACVFPALRNCTQRIKDMNGVFVS